MQYTDGTVTVTNGSTTVTGVGTQWTIELAAGNLFKLSGASPIYEIASITSDTELELVAAYQGATASGQPYVVARDFTLNYNLPEVHKGDPDWADVLLRFQRLVDAQMKTLDDRITVLEP